MAVEASAELKIADYELVRAVGQGGMAQVWLARRALMPGATKACALKVPLPHLSGDDRFVRMFLAEARLAMRLTHSNIVGTFDAGADGDLLYMAMEWVDGVDLAKLQRTMRDASVVWSPSVAAHIVGEILNALSYAHSYALGGVPQCIVHRDVSPHNVLVSASGEVKLTDFGIARMLGEDTSHEHAKGKLRYMAAEQLNGRASQQSDLFAVGAILHELLDGRKFRDGLTGDAFFGAIIKGEVPDLRRTDVPEIVEKLRVGLLQPDESNRIASADDALSLLAQWPGYRSQRVALRKAVQRHIGSESRRSGLTGYVPWTAEMAATLEVVDRQRRTASPRRTGVATEPHRAVALAEPQAAPPRPVAAPVRVAVPRTVLLHPSSTVSAVSPPRAETTAFARPAMVDREVSTVTTVPTKSDALWKVPSAASRPRLRARLLLGVAMVAGLALGTGGAVGIWLLLIAFQGERPTTMVEAQGRVIDDGASADAAPDRVQEPAFVADVSVATSDASEPPATEPPVTAPESSEGPDTVAASRAETPRVQKSPAARTGRPRPPSKTARVVVHVVLDFVDEAEVAVGRKRRMVRGPVDFQVDAGRQRIAWRVPGTRAWVSKRTVTLTPGHEHFIRVRPSGLRHEVL
ncbi:MAG: protein kinase [Nannocystaceae bacterium]|nr:protein kinase [Nannocystaceae bacterium]